MKAVKIIDSKGIRLKLSDGIKMTLERFSFGAVKICHSKYTNWLLYLALKNHVKIPVMSKFFLCSIYRTVSREICFERSCLFEYVKMIRWSLNRTEIGEFCADIQLPILLCDCPISDHSCIHCMTTGTNLLLEGWGWLVV